MIDYTIGNIKLDEMHIRILNGHPEIMLYITLYNKKGQKIGQIYMSSQKHYSDTQYILKEDITKLLIHFLNEINNDLFENYITYDSTK